MDAYVIHVKLTAEGNLWRWYERIGEGLLRRWHWTVQSPGSQKEQTFPMYIGESPDDSGSAYEYVRNLWDQIEGENLTP